jgi:hypothetical protein
MFSTIQRAYKPSRQTAEKINRFLIYLILDKSYKFPLNNALYTITLNQAEARIHSAAVDNDLYVFIC